MFAQVALPDHPLRRIFDYYLPALTTGGEPCPGMRVLVPWLNQKKVGVILSLSPTSDYDLAKIKSIIEYLDDSPSLDQSTLAFCYWASQYYHHPIGETISLALPPYLRQPLQRPAPKKEEAWHLTPLGEKSTPSELKSKGQRHLLTYFQLNKYPQSLKTLAIGGFKPHHLRPLIEKKLIEHCEPLPTPISLPIPDKAPVLNPEQMTALSKIQGYYGQFRPLILDGVTGSGKTEIYLQAMIPLIKASQQVLILVPEIGLTPQTVERFSQRFPLAEIAVFHSKLSSKARFLAWDKTRRGEAQIIIGTRSALFTPLPHLALIILDEVHDLSFKQQDGLRYSAKDLALKRGQLAKIPVILGSATHSLETFHQIQTKAYPWLRLSTRAGKATLPDIKLVDLNTFPNYGLLSRPSQERIQEHLDSGYQVFIFINRRGYAPILFCPDCRWMADCPHCDAHLTYYKKENDLKCHHCHYRQSKPHTCPTCHKNNLSDLGAGTQKILEQVQAIFKNYTCLRIDRDTTQNKEDFNQHLAQIHQGEAHILIGTQMLAKGHHFAHLSLVLILNVDQALCSRDSYASEYLAQLVTQVAGRAGRAEKKGEVLIETHFPDHPILAWLCQHNYHGFVQWALNEREKAGLPPYRAFAIIRTEAKNQAKALDFLHQVSESILPHSPENPAILGPFPALMTKKLGFFRASLILSWPNKQIRHQSLFTLMPKIEKIKASSLRWHLDLDPIQID